MEQIGVTPAGFLVVLKTSRNHVDFRGAWIYFFSRLWVGFGPLRAVSGAQVAKLEKTPVRGTSVAKFDTGPLS